MNTEENRQMDEKAKQALLEALMKRAEENKKGRLVRTIHSLGLSLFQAMVSVAFMGGVGMFVWNNILAGLFGSIPVTFLQACGIYVLTRLFLGGSVGK